MVIYRVTKCEIDLTTMHSDAYKQGRDFKKCEKVSQSAIKCDRFWIMSQNYTRGTLSYGSNRLVDCGAERLCVNDYSLSHDSLPHCDLPSHTRMYSSGVFGIPPTVCTHVLKSVVQKVPVPLR